LVGEVGEEESFAGGVTVDCVEVDILSFSSTFEVENENVEEDEFADVLSFEAAKEWSENVAEEDDVIDVLSVEVGMDATENDGDEATVLSFEDFTENVAEADDEVDVLSFLEVDKNDTENVVEEDDDADALSFAAKKGTENVPEEAVLSDEVGTDFTENVAEGDNGADVLSFELEKGDDDEAVVLSYGIVKDAIENVVDDSAAEVAFVVTDVTENVDDEAALFFEVEKDVTGNVDDEASVLFFGVEKDGTEKGVDEIEKGEVVVKEGVGNVVVAVSSPLDASAAVENLNSGSLDLGVDPPASSFFPSGFFSFCCSFSPFFSSSFFITVGVAWK
jgi:hypothetical protein